jgi:hypothetical protein
MAAQGPSNAGSGGGATSVVMKTIPMPVIATHPHLHHPYDDKSRASAFSSQYQPYTEQPSFIKSDNEDDNTLDGVEEIA